MTLNILPLLDANSSIPQAYIPKSAYTNISQMYLNGFMINDNLKFVKKIGAGTYGLIYLMEDIYNGKQFAAKMILKEPPVKHTSPNDVNANKEFIQMKIFNYFNSQSRINAAEIDLDFIKNRGINCPFLREIALHLRVHEHPNIISIHKVLNLDDLAIVILMDYFEQGDLFGNIIDKRIFLEPSIYQDKKLFMKNVMLQLIEAVEYCYSKGIYHCDLKPENIMVNYNCNYKRKDFGKVIDYNEIHIVLIDFGLAMSSSLICCNACRGSSFYMAPERIINYNTNNLIKSLVDMNQFKTVSINETKNINETNSKYFPTLAGDIWSLGVLFINITCARNPWPIASIIDQGDNLVFKNYILHNKNVLCSILPISKAFNRLLDKIFVLNPNDRISLSLLKSEIIKCDFFDGYQTIQQNEQLFTPPETDNEKNSPSSDQIDSEDQQERDYCEQQYNDLFALETPNSSFIHMEQCDKQVKNFSCPFHHN